MQLSLLSALLLLASFSASADASPVSRLGAAQQRSRIALHDARDERLRVRAVSRTTANTSKPVTASTSVSKAAVTPVTSKAAATTSKAATTSSTTSKAASTTPAVSSSTKASTTTSASSTTTTSTASTQVVVQLSAPPASSRTKQVFAHHMVGNTYSYTQSTWANDVSLASGAGIDAFALNTGRDYWQPGQVASAYAAAKGTSFKMFMSFDMTSLGCASEADAVVLRNYVTTYTKHPNQATYMGKQLVSTFAGENCYFGESSVQLGWQKHFLSPLAAANVTIKFLPAVFSDPSTFSTSTWFDGVLNWNSGWPMGSANLDTSSDQRYMSALGSKAYMAAVSPGFFTYYSPNTYNKDWIYRGDNWLYSTRWEDIIKMRDDFDMVEILTWNDYGESHYIGPIRADQPNSQAWVNNFPHQAYLDMTKFYATAFKTGKWPSITANKIFIWSRPHPKAATASRPSMARPTRWQTTDDNVYVLVMAAVASKVWVSTGNRRQAIYVQPGLTRFSMSSSPGTLGVAMAKSSDGSMISNVTWPASAFSYTLTPVDYNFNYWVGST